jgi:hypothetical protein
VVPFGLEITGTPHSFKNESARPARMLITVAPAGLEQMFFEVGVPLVEGATTAPPALATDWGWTWGWELRHFTTSSWLMSSSTISTSSGDPKPS